ncbi:MAG TPA: hypothetical protein VGI77_08510 [Gaiellaceae bacterium]
MRRDAAVGAQVERRFRSLSFGALITGISIEALAEQLLSIIRT